MTKLNNILEAIGEAYEDLRVEYDPPAMYLIAGIAVTGAERDDILGVVMLAHPNLDPLTQCRLTDRIATRLVIAEAGLRSRTAPRRAADSSKYKGPGGRPADTEMVFSAPGRILSVNGRPVR